MLSDGNVYFLLRANSSYPIIFCTMSYPERVVFFFSSIGRSVGMWDAKFLILFLKKINTKMGLS